MDDVPGEVRRRRRRSWSREEKEQIVAESYAPGASVSEVARRHDVNANMVFTWRRQGVGSAVDGETAAPALVPVTVMPEVPEARVSASTGDGAQGGFVQRAGMMEIDLGNGRRVRVGRDVDGSALRRVLSALERR
jgi:transposase